MSVSYVAQLLANGVVAGSVYALVGAGFALIYSVSRFFHFSHAATFTVGGYAAWSLMALGTPIVLAGTGGVAAAAVCGLLLERFLYRSFRRRSASALVLLLASIGVYTVLENTIAMVFGNQALSLVQKPAVPGTSIIGARLTEVQLAAVIITLVTFLALQTGSKLTKTALLIRAVASNATLAAARGISLDRVSLVVFCIGSGLSGIAGVLTAMDVDIVPTVGMYPFMMGVVAAVVGGVRSVWGSVFGGYMLGIAQNLSILMVDARWTPTLAFLVMILFLLLRPTGFFGKSVRSTTV